MALVCVDMKWVHFIEVDRSCFQVKGKLYQEKKREANQQVGFFLHFYSKSSFLHALLMSSLS